MLVLSRKIGEVVTIGSSVKITVLSFDRGVVRIGIDAPKSIPVHRKEVYDKIIELNKQSSKTDISSLKNLISGSGMKFNFQRKDNLEASTLLAENKSKNSLYQKK